MPTYPLIERLIMNPQLTAKAAKVVSTLFSVYVWGSVVGAFNGYTNTQRDRRQQFHISLVTNPGEREVLRKTNKRAYRQFARDVLDMSYKEFKAAEAAPGCIIEDRIRELAKKSHVAYAKQEASNRAPEPIVVENSAPKAQTAEEVLSGSKAS